MAAGFKGHRQLVGGGERRGWISGGGRRVGEEIDREMCMGFVWFSCRHLGGLFILSLLEWALIFGPRFQIPVNIGLNEIKR